MVSFSTHLKKNEKIQFSIKECQIELMHWEGMLFSTKIQRFGWMHSCQTEEFLYQFFLFKKGNYRNFFVSFCQCVFFVKPEETTDKWPYMIHFLTKPFKNNSLLHSIAVNIDWNNYFLRYKIFTTYLCDPRFKHIMTVLYNVNQMAGDLYIEMETDVFFDIKMVTTDKTQRRGGLATDLLRRSVELARNLGFKAVKTEATGMYLYPFWLKGHP